MFCCYMHVPPCIYDVKKQVAMEGLENYDILKVSASHDKEIP